MTTEDGGSDPNFTGGLSSADYLRQLQGGALVSAALQMAQAEIGRLVAANLRVRAERDALRAEIDRLQRQCAAYAEFFAVYGPWEPEFEPDAEETVERG